MDEARRLLRPGGTLLVTSVNCQWHGFNPSPLSVRYHSGEELVRLAESAGFRTRLWAAFPDRADSWSRRIVSLLRRTAVAMRMVPRTMKGKALLKRLFYGPLHEVPWEIGEETAPAEPLRQVEPSLRLGDYKMLYLEAFKETG